MAASIPNIDRVARDGRTGLFTTIPEGLPRGSAVANLSVLGYDPHVTFEGRGVLEAASMGVELGEGDVAMRCNLISLDGDNIKNHSSGHITNDEASELISMLAKELGSGTETLPVCFHRGVSYRHLLVLLGGWAKKDVECAPPHDHVGEPVAELLPRAKSEPARVTAARLRDLYERALPLLASHPVNRKRREEGKDTADAVWPWSPGYRPSMKTLKERFGVKGAVISAVDLVIGLGCYAGMKPIHVEGATGLHDTNYEGKAQACLDALETHDLVYVHVEASDEAGHSKDLDLKIRCIEYLDKRLVAPILRGIEGKNTAVAVLPDHPTPVETGSHATDPVPVAILTPGAQPDAVQGYDEEQVKAGSLGMLQGDQFIRTLLAV
jgi:2,3-bisphosphoglycerate-independent phosphoglycerate mutase